MKKITNKEKLIKAADELLKNKSISAVGIKEITLAAEVSVGVFYNYFTDKEEVFKEVVEKFYSYSIQEVEKLRKSITGKNIRSELKLKEFLIDGIEKNWENHFLNSDIVLQSKNDKKFEERLAKYSFEIVKNVAEILQILNPNLTYFPVIEAEIILNMIQNSFPLFSHFKNESQKEVYIEKFVEIIYSLCFLEGK